MGLLSQALTPLFTRAKTAPPFSLTRSSSHRPRSWGTGSHEQMVREGYLGNELVYAAVDLLATSAAEPRIVGRRFASSAAREESRAYLKAATATGYPLWAATRRLSKSALMETLVDHPAVTLLNHPNPFVSRFQMWATVIMDRGIAGNAFLWKARVRPSSPPSELWRLRPDRVRVIPDDQNYIKGYVYRIGGDEYELPREDVLHFKTRHPLNEHYGMSPLMPLAGRIDIDNYMRLFVAAFFEHGGQPGAVLSVEGEMSPEDKAELKRRFREDYGGPSGWFDVLVLENTKSTYTPQTMGLGGRGLIVPELAKLGEARIAAAFGIPASILGAWVGLESSSYANKRADWNVLWDVTLAPMYSDLDDVLNLSLLPDFQGVDELIFDLADVKALQEDVDALHERARRNVATGLWTIEEARVVTGVDSFPDGGHFLFPAGLAPTAFDQLDQLEPRARQLATLPTGGRPRLEDDAGARELYERGLLALDEQPGLTMAEVADRIGISERTWRRYRSRFEAEKVTTMSTTTIRHRIERDDDGFIIGIVEEEVR